MQNDDTLTAMEFAGLSTYETWMHYCNMGGWTDYFEFDAYLYGVYTLDDDDARWLRVRVVRLQAAVIFPMLAFIGASAPVLIPALYGSQWASAVPVLQAALFRLRTANWQTAWYAANDHAPQGLDTVTYRQTQRLPVYRNGTRVYGTEP